MTDTDRWLIWIGVPVFVLLVDWLQRKVEGWGERGGARAVHIEGDFDPLSPEPSTEGGGAESAETKGAANGPGLRDGVGARPIEPRWRA